LGSGAIKSEVGTAYIKFVPQYLLPQLASTIKIKKSKKLSKSCQKVVKKLSKSCQKMSKSKNNGAIVEKVQWCNSKKVNGKKKKKKKKKIGIP
jgi:hypothetical protein